MFSPHYCQGQQDHFPPKKLSDVLQQADDFFGIPEKQRKEGVKSYAVQSGGS
jgi:hypothetical protein